MAELLQGGADQDMIIKYTQQCRELVGDMAELGVYQGGSAKIICDHKGSRDLYLFDTFMGLPRPTSKDVSDFHECDYAESYANVSEFLKDYEKVHYVRGLFPLTTLKWKHLLFSFVHFDADLYESCKDAIEYFYPRLVTGGVMLFHDFRDGVLQAVNESGIKYEKLSSNQGLIRR